MLNDLETGMDIKTYDSQVEIMEPSDDSNISKSEVDDLKLDKYGLPLIPQPSRFKDDPLVGVSTFAVLDLMVGRV